MYYLFILPYEEITLKMKNALELNEIYPKRYFYPSLSGLNYVNPVKTPIADDIASRILCLPLYHELGNAEQDMVARIMLRVQRN